MKKPSIPACREPQDLASQIAAPGWGRSVAQIPGQKFVLGAEGPGVQRESLRMRIGDEARGFPEGGVGAARNDQALRRSDRLRVLRDVRQALRGSRCA